MVCAYPGSLTLLFAQAAVVSARVGNAVATQYGDHPSTKTISSDTERQLSSQTHGALETPEKSKGTARGLSFYGLAPSSDRVNNGQQSLPGEYPFYAQMWWGERSQGCGGSLIASRWILTAGHCVDDFVDQVAELNYPEWRVGAYCADTDNCDIPQELIRSKRGLLHPSFNRFVPTSDYALVELETSATTIPVQIDDGRVFASLRVGSTVRGLGFGYLNDSKDLPFYLQKVDNQFVPLQICRRRYTTGVYFDDSIMCTNGINYGMCVGDSGSPVIATDLSSPHGFRQVSVSSFGGPRCGNHDVPDVSARISTVYSWIQDQVCPTYGSAADRPHFCRGGQYEQEFPPSAPPSPKLPDECTDESEYFHLFNKNKRRKCRKIKSASKVRKLCNNAKSDALEKCRKSCGVCYPQ